MSDEIEVGRLEEDHGVMVFLGKTVVFFIRKGESFSMAVVSGGFGFTGGKFELDAIKITAALDNFRVASAKTFALEQDVNSLENGSFAAAVGAENEGSFAIANQAISGVAAEISKLEGTDNHEKLDLGLAIERHNDVGIAGIFAIANEDRGETVGKVESELFFAKNIETIEEKARIEVGLAGVINFGSDFGVVFAEFV